MILFRMSADTALKFYKQCMDEKVEDELSRIRIIMNMVQNNNISISHTNKTKEQVLKDLQLHYKKILSIEPKKKK